MAAKMDVTTAQLPTINWQWRCDSVAPRRLILCTNSPHVNDERMFELSHTLSSAVPVMAITKTQFHQAQIECFPDQLMQRIGLFVVQADVRRFAQLSHIAPLDPYSTHVLRFEVDSHQHCTPHHAESFMLMSQHFKWLPNEGQEDITPPTLLPDMPIVKLMPGKHMHATCCAIRGDGLEHAKWSPISGFTYSCAAPEEGRHQSTTIVDLTGALTADIVIELLGQLVQTHKFVNQI